MDAVKYLKEEVRMCAEHRCENCPLGKAGDEQYCSSCCAFEEEYPEEAVAIVEKWSAEHPVKTRQSEFLKMFPNAVIRDSYIDIKSCEVDTEFECPDRNTVSCGECKQRYWSEEVE